MLLKLRCKICDAKTAMIKLLYQNCDVEILISKLGCKLYNTIYVCENVCVCVCLKISNQRGKDHKNNLQVKNQWSKNKKITE